MITIRKTSQISSAPDRVWEIVSDIDNDEMHWTNIRHIRVLNRKGNTIEREAEVGPKSFSQKSRQTLVLDPEKSIKLTMTGGSIDGERTLVLVPMGKNGTRVDVTWKLELKGVPGFVHGLVKRQISKATGEALTKIKEEAERAVGPPNRQRSGA